MPTSVPAASYTPPPDAPLMQSKCETRSSVIHAVAIVRLRRPPGERLRPLAAGKADHHRRAGRIVGLSDGRRSQSVARRDHEDRPIGRRVEREQRRRVPGAADVDRDGLQPLGNGKDVTGREQHAAFSHPSNVPR